MGYRCGYVGCKEMPEGDIYELDVHGGITYEGDGSFEWQKEGYRYIGFDCAHGGDKKDIELLKKYFPDCAEGIRFAKSCESFEKGWKIRTQEYVESEVNKLIKQIKDEKEK